MALRIAINGFGRIGRCVARAIAESSRSGIELVAINGPSTVEKHVHLLKYDSVHGIFNGVKQTGKDTLDIGRGPVKAFSQRDPLKIPWGELGVDVVFECTGKLKTKEDLEKHFASGAKKVLVSAPAEGAEVMVVYGVNNDALKGGYNIISVGSCTTNCLAPVAQVLDQEFGIETGFMTTIHAYTNDQNILDNNHSDMRRAGAAALSMIPTSTGAAKSIGKVLPNLSGKLDGVAVRVPTPNVSMVDFTVTTSEKITSDTVNQAMKAASEGKLRGVLGYSDEELVSVDFLHNDHSSVFDATGTKTVGPHLLPCYFLVRQ